MRHTRRTLLRAGITALASSAACGQAQEQLTFEVASLRPSPPPEPNGRVFYGPPRGGPGTRDPGRITWANAALRNILLTAYDVQTFQITAPGWLSSARYDIVANVPSGATKEQVRVMWQNLLKDRFGVELHHESKEFQVDELIVAKSGLKLTPSDLGPNPDPFAPSGGPPSSDKNGNPEMNGFGAIVTVTPDRRARMFAKGLTLADIAFRFGQQLRHPVIDKTGLTGRYDFTLEYTPDLSGMPLPPGDTASEPGSSLPSAVEKQLGLKLSRAKAQLDVIVVDHAEKTPTAN